MVPKSIEGRLFQTRNLKYWVLGPSGISSYKNVGHEFVDYGHSDSWFKRTVSAALPPGCAEAARLTSRRSSSCQRRTSKKAVCINLALSGELWYFMDLISKPRFCNRGPKHQSTPMPKETKRGPVKSSTLHETQTDTGPNADQDSATCELESKLFIWSLVALQ